MPNQERFQTLVNEALKREAECKQAARAKREQQFKAALDQVLAQALRDDAGLTYGWNQERQIPQATFSFLAGAHSETCDITFDSDHDLWTASTGSGSILVAHALKKTFQQELLVAVGQYQDQASRPAVSMFS